MKKSVWETYVTLIFIAFVTVSCASSPDIVKRLDVPHGAEIAVISFRDCVIEDQEDCDGSGNVAGSVFARVFSESPRFRAVPLSRPVGAKEMLSDDQAADFAAEKGFEYVINGEVDEYYAVAPMTFRADRAGISMRILRTSDAAVVAFYSDRKEAGNFSTPDRIIEKMATRIRDGL